MHGTVKKPRHKVPSAAKRSRSESRADEGHRSDHPRTSAASREDARSRVPCVASAAMTGASWRSGDGRHARAEACASIPLSPQPKSKSSAFSPSGCGISFRPSWPFMRSCPRASGTLNQRQKHARARPMLGETNRRGRRDGRPAHRQHLAPGPLHVEGGETSAHATLCRKTPYARRQTRSPRPGGQGVHS
jgi:hypothetical protein